MASDVGKALRAKLLENTTLTGLIGTRFYPDVIPQGAALPAVSYYKISTQREHTLLDCTRLAHSRIQVDCYAEKANGGRDRANDIAHAIRNSGICAFRGTVDGIAIQAVEIDSGDYYDNDPPTDGNQQHRYITSFDFMVHYLEAA